MNANQRRRNNNNNNNNTSTRARIVNRNGSLLVRVSVVLIHWFSSEGTMHQVPPFNCENAGHSKNVLRCWPDIRKRTRTDLIESIRLDRQRQQQLLNYVEYPSVFRILYQFVTVFVILSVVPSSKHSLLVSFLAPICLTSLFSNYRWRAISISSSTATACVAVAAVLLSLKADVSAFVGIHYDNVAAFVCCAVLCWLIWICSPHWLDILAKSNAQFTIDLVTTSKRVLRHQTFKRRRFYSYLVSCLNTFWFRHWQRHCHLSVSDLLTQWIPIGRTTWWKQLCFIRRMLTANQHHSAAVCSDVLQPLTKHNSPQFTLNEVKKEATWSSIKLPTVHKLINLSDRGKKLSRSSSNASSPSRASKILLALLIQSRLIVSSTSTTVLSGGGSGHFQQLTAESLNPWLSADGGLILRAISAANNNQNSLSLNWIRSNAGACVPQPTTLACPSDRYCRLPEIASGNLAGSRETSAFFDRSFRPTTTTATSAMNEGEQDAASQTIAPETAVANASQCLPYLRPTNKSSSSSSTNRSKSSSSGSSNSSIPSPVECICGHVDGAKRIDALRKYHLHHCYHYKLWYVLSDTMLEGIARSRSQCYAYLAVVEQLDNLAAHFVCQFEDIIRRYDCAQTFSSKSSCQQCKVRTIETTINQYIQVEYFIRHSSSIDVSIFFSFIMLFKITYSLLDYFILKSLWRSI